MEINGILHTNEESVIRVLRQGYLESFNLRGKIYNKALVLSDRRIYQTGRTYEFINGLPRSCKGYKIVDLDKITGLASKTIDSMIHLLFAALAGLIMFINNKMLTNKFPELDIVFIVIILVSCIRYFFIKRKYIHIYFSGGSMVADVSGHSKEVINDFLKDITIAKETFLQY